MLYEVITCEEKTSMTIDTAMRLSRALGTTPEFWMNLQMNYDLLTRGPDDLGDMANHAENVGDQFRLFLARNNFV